MSIWKTPLGEFVNVINPTEREIRILIKTGCKEFQSSEEFIKDSERIDDGTTNT
jgi:hypothetical protein